MKIIIDDKIPYIKGVLEPYAEVVYLPGKLTTAEVLKEADALVTRTRTTCNEAVLSGSRVNFIATATIGFDHIDTRYCEQAGIEWVNAPGCNAESVNQYVSSALFSYSIRKGFTLKGKTIGIVGVGQVGSRIARTCETLGMNVLLNDPPRERVEGASQFVSLHTIQQQADIISFHVPLNRGGADNTFHMVDEEFVRNLGRKPLLINTCRGEVLNSATVLEARQADKVSGLIIDCWENEPGLDLKLLKLVDFGTSHIAGYSKDGKANGTKMSIRAISKYFGLGIDDWEPSGVEPPSHPVINLDGAGRSEESVLAEAIRSTYRIENDDRALRENTELFERLRDDYPVRREFASHAIQAKDISPDIVGKLTKLGFKLMVAG
jgi:erythronate-4-phosphate dehydrogenase